MLDNGLLSVTGKEKRQARGLFQQVVKWDWCGERGWGTLLLGRAWCLGTKALSAGDGIMYCGFA